MTIPHKFFKTIASLLFIVLSSLQSSTYAAAPSGQYGCMLNRNFGGWDAAIGVNTNSSNVGSNFLLYLNFDVTPNTISAVVNVSSNYGGSNAIGSQIIPGSATVTLNANTPITGVYQASDGVPYGLTMDLLPVNGGNTLFVISGMGVSAGSNTLSLSGVCNKV